MPRHMVRTSSYGGFPKYQYRTPNAKLLIIRNPERVPQFADNPNALENCIFPFQDALGGPSATGRVSCVALADTTVVFRV